MAVTTTVCDDHRHWDCPGTGLVEGILRPNHEPDHEGEQVWVTVKCGCPCHIPPHDDACSIAGCIPSCPRRHAYHRGPL